KKGCLNCAVGFQQQPHQRATRGLTRSAATTAWTLITPPLHMGCISLEWAPLKKIIVQAIAGLLNRDKICHLFYITLNFLGLEDNLS
ncbi:unnamed protein product, partial [Prunus brigantina]